LQSRRFDPKPWTINETTPVTYREFCFSHLNIVNPPDNKTVPVPWWLALVISVPLAIITIAIIKIALIIREKNLREEKAKDDQLLYAKLEEHKKKASHNSIQDKAT